MNSDLWFRKADGFLLICLSSDSKMNFVWDESLFGSLEVIQLTQMMIRWATNIPENRRHLERRDIFHNCFKSQLCITMIQIIFCQLHLNIYNFLHYTAALCTLRWWGKQFGLLKMLVPQNWKKKSAAFKAFWNSINHINAIAVTNIKNKSTDDP